MKPRRSNQRNQALTLVEVIVIVAVLMFLGACLLSVLKATNKGAKAINCLNNLHQIGVAHQLWVGDLNNQFPLLTFAADNDGGKSARNDSAYVLWQACPTN